MPLEVSTHPRHLTIARRTDPKGESAIKEWVARKDAIHAGLDGLRVSRDPVDGLTLGELAGRFLVSQRDRMSTGELSAATYGDYVRELRLFTSTAGIQGLVAAMKPDHFAAYAKHLSVKRKLGPHARKRIIAYVKAMFHWGAAMGLHAAPTFGRDFRAPDTSPAATRKRKAREGEADHSDRILTGDELDRLLSVAPPQFRALILVGVNCGLGPADLGRLRWRDIDMGTGELDMPRGKTGADRRGYLWKRTRRALERVQTLKHNRLAIKRDGQDALVFVTRKGLPMYREVETFKTDDSGNKVSSGVKVSQAVSITFGRLVERAKLAGVGVTFYRLRHTFKTLGKQANDRDALDLAMGHIQPGIGKVYDHEEIGLDRLRRVSVAVKRRLWPKVKQRLVEGKRQRNREGSAAVAGA